MGKDELKEKRRMFHGQDGPIWKRRKQRTGEV